MLRNSGSAKSLALGLILAAGGALLWWLSAPRVDVSAMSDENRAVADKQSQWKRLLEENFAFDRACAECHAEQFAAHQRSGHSRTATFMSVSSLADELSGSAYRDARRDQTFQFQNSDDGFFVSTNDEGQTIDFPVHWLLGSGTHASTPVSIDPRSGSGVEFRWTWFATTGELGLTPDHERFDDFRPGSLECFGRPLSQKQALACLGCHMTAVPPEDVAPTRDMFVEGVGCERCHGPRKKHVELARIGRAADAPPAFTYDNPLVYLDRCAQCHRDETNIPDESSASSLARYQPYGLKQSKCYLNSSKQMTCSTCHDPHDRVSTDSLAYNRTCTECHTAPKLANCSLQPTGNCVECHMPAVEWHSGIAFHDHWIRIPETKKPAETPAK